MLIAIGIYNYNDHFDNIRFIKLASAQSASRSFLFTPNLLEPVEKTTLTSLTLTELRQSMPVHFEQSGEHHYIKSVMGESTIIAISSRSRLDNIELHHLLNNIWFAFKQPLADRVTLQHIINNPLGYTGQDCRIAATKEELDELKKYAVRVLDKVIERGEKLEDLNARTAELIIVSEQFVEETQKLNDSCCSMW